MFDPGIYYINGGGFKTINSTVGMCTSCAADPTTINGMLIYDTGPVSGGCTRNGWIYPRHEQRRFLWCWGISSQPHVDPSSPILRDSFLRRQERMCSHSHDRTRDCVAFR